MAEPSTQKPNLIKKTFSEFSEDQCSMMAAALAYYAAFSLPFLLVIVVTIAGWIWSPDAVTAELKHEIAGVVGQGGWQQIETMMQRAGQDGGGTFATIIGVVALLLGATGFMIQLQSAMNTAWQVEPDPEQGGVLKLLLKRVISLAMIIVIVFVLLVSLVLTAVLSAASGTISEILPANLASWLPQVTDAVVSLIVITLLFAGVLKWLPDAHIEWRETWVGAFVTAVLFLIGKFALGFYFGVKETDMYGAAGAFALILIWIYYSAMIFLLGTEFTQVWARRHGHQIQPVPGAVRVVKETKRIDATHPEAT